MMVVSTLDRIGASLLMFFFDRAEREDPSLDPRLIVKLL